MRAASSGAARQRGLALSFLVTAFVLVLASVAWACTVKVGQTYLYDKESGDSHDTYEDEPQGGFIYAHMHDASSGYFRLVIGESGDHPGHPCMYVTEYLSGSFYHGGGHSDWVQSEAIDVAKGEWEVCFRETDASTSTGAATVAVI